MDLARGAEMGRFNMGSTVVLLLANPQVRWAEGLETGCPIRQGETIAIAPRARAGLPGGRKTGRKEERPS